jgi:hypothetical protein
MRSIIRFPVAKNMEELLMSIEAITRGYVIGYSTLNGEAIVTIGHHDGPVCPECGAPIHIYGHGLCLACWKRLKPF